jgi:hypothetical protein
MRVIPVHRERSDEWDAGALMPVLSPLSEMARVASAVANGDRVAAEMVLDHASQRLQQVATDELHRMIGQLVADVALAGSLRAKVGIAVTHGSRLIESRPPDHVFRQFHDPEEFVARCRAVWGYVEMFLAAALNRALVDAGRPRLEHPEAIVKDMATELSAALRATHEDGVDRKAAMVRSFLAIVGDEDRRPGA